MKGDQQKVASFLKQGMGISTLFYPIWCVFGMLMILCFTMKVKIQNKALIWFGSTTFFNFTLPGIPQIISAKYLTNNYLIYTLVIVAAILLTAGTYYVFEKSPSERKKTMKDNTIRNFRNLYSSLFTFLRKKHMRKVVYRQKTTNSAGNVLSKEQKKQAQKFYAPYGKISTVYHNFYTEKTGEYHVNYIPDDIYFNDINYYYNDFQAFKFIDNKTNYDKLFPTIHQPAILAARKNGFWYLGDELVTLDTVRSLLQKYTTVFVKRATDCGGASGVFCLENSSSEQFRAEFDRIVETISTDIAIQKMVVQHEDISKLNPDSVNTLRILTLLHKNGEVKVYSSILRIGGGKGRVDNFCAGGMAVGVDDAGKLKEYGYYLNGNRITEHPMTKVSFLGYEVPSFEAAKDLVKRAHLYVPHFRMVSWDVAIESDGTPTLIEANLADGQLDLHQLTNGPLFGEDTVRVLDEVFLEK